MVEWPERGAGGELPAPDASLYLEPLAAARRARFIAVTPAGDAWVTALVTDSGS
jgi:hypothetical protein